MTKILKNYTCTLEQAKRLKKLGVQQDSLSWYAIPDSLISTYIDIYENTFIAYETGETKRLPNYKYTIDIPREIHVLSYNDIKWLNNEMSVYCEILCSAFTSQELGELISNLCDALKEGWYQTMELKTKIDDYYFWVDGEIVFSIGSPSEAQVRAAFLIYKLEQKK
jgi:hypothetical protein